jgi:HTH-type transcriptional regulator, sugar sensing transcriptional regulator
MNSHRDHLIQIGLNDKSAMVYLTLLQLGSGTVSEIAAKSLIKRSTIYDCLEELADRELITQSLKGKRRLFVAKDPEFLKRKPTKEMEIIESQLPELKAIFSSGDHKPKLSYQEGQEGIKRAYDDILESSIEEYYYFGNENDIIQATGLNYMKDYVERRKAKGIWSNAIRIRNKDEKHSFLSGKEENLRRVRYIDTPSMHSTASITIYPTKVVIISTLNEAYALSIESKECHQMMMLIWNTLWKSIQ